MFDRTQYAPVLKGPTLLREATFIGGEWTAAHLTVSCVDLASLLA